jgi:DNA-binding IclR family transcriptional regulator
MDMRQENNKAADTGALGKGLHLLHVMQQAPQPLALSEIASTAQMSSSSAHRVLKSLIDLGYVHQNAAGRYGPTSYALLPMALGHPLNVLRRDSFHLLDALRTRYGPSAKLVVFQGTNRAIAEIAIGRYSITPYFDTHELASWNVSVSGKLLMSGMAPEECDSLLGPAPYPARTRHSIVDRDALFEELAQVRRTGLASSFNENVMGVSSLGVRLLSPSQRIVAAILLTGPTDYFTAHGQLQAMREELLQTAELLSSTSQSLRSFAQFMGV